MGKTSGKRKKKRKTRLRGIMRTGGPKSQRGSFKEISCIPSSSPIYDLTRWNSCPKRKKHKNK